MLSRKLALGSLGALAGAAMLTLTMSPASALTLASPSIDRQVAASSLIEKTYYRCWWRGGHRFCRRW